MWQALVAAAVAGTIGIVAKHFLKPSADHTQKPYNLPSDCEEELWFQVSELDLPLASVYEEGDETFRFSNSGSRDEGFRVGPRNSSKRKGALRKGVRAERSSALEQRSGAKWFGGVMPCKKVAGKRESSSSNAQGSARPVFTEEKADGVNRVVRVSEENRSYKNLLTAVLESLHSVFLGAERRSIPIQPALQEQQKQMIVINLDDEEEEEMTKLNLKRKRPKEFEERQKKSKVYAQASKRITSTSGSTPSTPTYRGRNVVAEDVVVLPSGSPFTLVSRIDTLLPGSKVNDPQFIVPDLSDAQVAAMTALPPRFSLLCQSVYENYFEKDWDKMHALEPLEKYHRALGQQLSALITSLANFQDMVDMFHHHQCSSKTLEELKRSKVDVQAPHWNTSMSGSTPSTPTNRGQKIVTEDVVVLPSASLLASTPRRDSLLPVLKVHDPQFIISDLSDAQVAVMSALPARFSLLCQFVYDNYFEKDWDRMQALEPLEKYCHAISQQLSALITSLANYHDMVDTYHQHQCSSNTIEELKKDVEKYRLGMI